MSVKSLPVPDKFDRRNVQEASLDAGVGIPVQLRRSSCLKMATERSDFEVEKAKRSRIIMKSRARYIRSLTKLRGNSEELMENYKTLEDMTFQGISYDEAL